MGKEDEPTAAELAAKQSLWDELLADLATEYSIDIQEWHSYSRKAGWAMRVKHGKRTILYLSPGHSAFRASFALGDKAVQAARRGGLPARVLKIISEAKRYAEGTVVRIDVKSPTVLLIVKKLAGAKLEN